MKLNEIVLLGSGNRAPAEIDPSQGSISTGKVAFASSIGEGMMLVPTILVC